MEDIIINVKNVSMRFNIYQQKIYNIKEYFIKLLKGQLEHDEFTALDGITFSVKKGSSLALVGRNGSGKSTLLKILAGVMKPTTGNAIVHGSIAPLIELGAGFDPELTAEENIYLNGAVLGYSHSEMEEKFNKIVEFSELKEFLSVPIKNFSSGMYARLGFSIATVRKPDILIVDEILSVGDFKFQEKCKNKINEILKDGTTLLFVSHSMEEVETLCENAIWLENGKIRLYGKSKTVCDEYLKS